MPDNKYLQVCSYENLFLAYEKARKGKTKKPYVLEFEKNLKQNLLQLRADLLFRSYRPEPLTTFIIKDPKTRKISKSAFRDRIVHHALYNVIEPLFERQFIYDSYANRIGKGTLKAIKRFEVFARKVSHNHQRPTYVLKADIRHYFDTVDHEMVINLIRRRCSDNDILLLIQKILKNYKTTEGKGMPLGNLTSQFLANVYLHELDFFVKYTLRVKYYIRYVDDFVLLHESRDILNQYKEVLNEFLSVKLQLTLHPQKSKIIQLHRGTEFLGMRIFQRYRLLKTKNLKKFYRKYKDLMAMYTQGGIDIDDLYDFLEGWFAYAAHANTYKLTQRILQDAEPQMREIPTKEVNRYLKLTRNMQ